MPGHELLSPSGQLVKVKAVCLRPAYLRDFVCVDVNTGAFDTSADHHICACWEGKAWSRISMRDLRPGMLVHGRESTQRVLRVCQQSNVAACVVEIYLEDRDAMIMLMAGSGAVGVLGARPGRHIYRLDLAKKSYDVISLHSSDAPSKRAATEPCSPTLPTAMVAVSQHSFPASLGSADHYADRCNGACPHVLHRGCRKGVGCYFCHIEDCTEPRYRPGKEKRDRHKRQGVSGRK